MALMREEQPEIIIFENVATYDEEVLKLNFGDLYRLQKAQLDPRLFGYPMSRPRLYFILTRLGRAWLGCNPGSWLDEVQHVLDRFNKEVMASPMMFAAEPDENSKRKLTPGEKKYLTQYRKLKKPLLNRCAIVDLSQSGKQPVTLLVDGSLGSLRCNSKLYVQSVKEFLSGKQLMRALGWPVHLSDCETAGLSKRQLPEELSNSDLVAMAGNSMFAPCVSLTFLAIVLRDRLP